MLKACGPVVANCTTVQYSVQYCTGVIHLCTGFTVLNRRCEALTFCIPLLFTFSLFEETSQNFSVVDRASQMAGGVYGSSKSSRSSKRSLMERLTDGESRESSRSKGSSDQNSGSGSGNSHVERASDSSSGHGNVWAINFQEVRSRSPVSLLACPCSLMSFIYMQCGTFRCA